MLFLYLIVFLAKDYWEAEPDKKESMRGLIKGFNLKKGKNRVLIELVALLIFSGILNQMWVSATTSQRPMWLV
jgi:hypothetical protein